MASNTDVASNTMFKLLSFLHLHDEEIKLTCMQL